MSLDCPICLDSYSDLPQGDFWVSAGCGVPEDGGPRVRHVFHKKCLAKNVVPGSRLSTQVVSCPMCRHNINLKGVTCVPHIDVEPDNNEFHHELKIGILGKYKAGKSSIMNRFARNTFDPNYTITKGVDCFVKFVKIGDKRIKLQLWDTAGQERHRAFVSGYVRNMFGMVFAYDITDKTTFEAIQDWVNLADDNGPTNSKRILIGNKLDLEDQREVSFAEGQDLASRLKMNFLECSAKEAYNIPEIFRTLTSEMLDTQPLLAEADAIFSNIRLRDELRKLDAVTRCRVVCC